jgi:hypothetical protein
MSHEQLERETNKSIVLAFYDEVVNQTDFEGAAPVSRPSLCPAPPRCTRRRRRAKSVHAGEASEVSALAR